MEYENIHTKEIVLEEEAEEYVKEKLGIEIKPVRRVWNNNARTNGIYECIYRMVFFCRLDKKENRK